MLVVFILKGGHKPGMMMHTCVISATQEKFKFLVTVLGS